MRPSFKTALLLSMFLMSLPASALASTTQVGGLQDIIITTCTADGSGGYYNCYGQDATFGYEIYANVTAPNSVTTSSSYQITVSKQDPGTGLANYSSLNCVDYAGENPSCLTTNAKADVYQNGVYIGSVPWGTGSQTFTLTSGSTAGSDTIEIRLLPAAGYSFQCGPPPGGVNGPGGKCNPIVASVSVPVTTPSNPTTCSTAAPTSPPCVSAPNSCGQTNPGTWQCADPVNNVWTCNQGTAPSNNSCPQPQPTNPPIVNMWWTPNSVAYNAYSNIQWSTTNATYCDFWLNGAYVGNTNSGWPLQNNSGGWSYGPLTTNQTYSMTCTGSGGTTSSSATVTVGTAINHARCDAITTNTQYMAGEAFGSTVVMNNDGTQNWDTTNSYRLGSFNPLDNLTWGLNRVNLPSSPIIPGGAASFTVNATAPSTPGTYSFNWEMVQDGGSSPQWFANACSSNPTVKVNAKPTTPVVTGLSCPAPGTTATISVSDGANNPAVTAYLLRIDDLSDGWDNCNLPDRCAWVTPNASGVASYTFSTTAGKSYRAWAHPCVGDIGDVNGCNLDASVMGMSSNITCQAPSVAVTLSCTSRFGGTSNSFCSSYYSEYYGDSSVSTAQLTWSATGGATSCSVYKNSVAPANLIGSYAYPGTTSYRIPAPGLTNVTTSYLVTCTNGAAATSNQVTFGVPPQPTAGSVTFNSDATQATLNFNLPVNHTQYYIRAYKTSYSNVDVDNQVACHSTPMLTPPEGTCNTTPITGNPYTMAVTPGVQYRWYLMTSTTSANWSTPSIGAPFTPVAGAQPDLTAAAPTPVYVTVGQANTLTANITNSGTASTGAIFPNIFQFADDSSGTNAQTPVGGTQITGLNASQTKTTTYSYTPTIAKTYYIRACADLNPSMVGIVTESNEGNNCSGSPYTAVMACNGGCGGGGACLNGANNPPLCNVFTATATLSSNPSTVSVNPPQTATLTWNSTGATSCTGVGFNTGNATSGTANVGPYGSAGTQNYQVTCSGVGGTSAPANATITVVAPSATISATPQRVPVAPGNTSTISWTSNQVSSCIVTGPGLNSTNVSGTQSVTVTGQSTYTITCQALSGGQLTNSTIVNVSTNIQDF